MFKITGNKGFKITFKNDVTISVQFGGGNYCDNRYDKIHPPPVGDTECANAEVAMWVGKCGNWITKEYDLDYTDDVVGDIEPDELLDMLIWAKARKVK